MFTRFRRDTSQQESKLGLFRHVVGLSGQIQFFVHRNRENKILHTALVGEMNGVLSSLTLGTPQGRSMVKCGRSLRDRFPQVRTVASASESMLASPRSRPRPRSVKHRTQLGLLSIRDVGIVNDGLVWVESVVSAEGCAMQSLLC